MLRTITSDSLTIEIGNGLGPMTYALANVSTIEEKTGTYTSGRTILTTMAVTTLAGGLILGIGSAGCEGWLCPTPAEGFAIGLLAGAALGLPLGLVLTPLIRYDRWELVSMPASPTRVGFGLSVTVPLPAW